MKLRFSGQNYLQDNVNIETFPSDITVCFKGQAYALRYLIYSLKPQFNIRTYRGVLYCKNF